MNHTDPATYRKMIYALLIVVAAGGVAGRIGSSELVLEPSLHKKDPNNKEEKGRKWPAVRPEPMPTFSSNDRSRWATVRALVDEGTFAVGTRQTLPATSGPTYQDSGIIFEDGWGSVDKILHPETHRFYSTKPPLLSTIAAGLYWLLQALFGWSLKTNPFSVVRTTLVLFNLLPFVAYLALLARLVERHGTTDWGRFFVLAAACFATLVSPFLITFNNHTVATCCVLFALYPVWPLVRFPWDRAPTAVSPLALAAAGFFAGFAACNELPALAFAAALAGICLFQAPRQTLLFFVPALLLPLAGQYALNYLALGEWNFAYSKFGSEWYEYPGSHWQKPAPGQLKTGIDWAWQYENRATYAFNVLVGHHGLFSLTPIWILALVGMGWALRRIRASASAPLVVIGAMTAVLTVVVVGFYLFNDPTTHNYSGWSNGLRWLMWLTPLWLLTMLPVADWLGQRRWGRGVAYAALGWSIFSASYFLWNPWRHPWLYNLFDSGGYIPY